MTDRDQLAALKGFSAGIRADLRATLQQMDQLEAALDELAALLVASDDYSRETVVVLTIRPPIDEARWKALHATAVEAGAVHAHINPPALLTAHPPEAVKEMAGDFTASDSIKGTAHGARQSAETNDQVVIRNVRES